jgi:hypothetical protein
LSLQHCEMFWAARQRSLRMLDHLKTKRWPLHIAVKL